MQSRVAASSMLNRLGSTTSTTRFQDDQETQVRAVQGDPESSTFRMLDILDAEKKKRCWALFIISMSAFPAMIVQFELLFANNSVPNLSVELCKLCITLSSILSVIALAAIYQTNYRLAVVSNIIFDGANFFRTPLILPFLLEFLANILHVPAWVDFTLAATDVAYPANSITYPGEVLQLIILVRIYQLPRLVHVSTRLGGGTGRWLRAFAYLDVSWPFTIKSLLRSHPMRLILAVFFLVFPLLSYTHRVCDWPVNNTSRMFGNTMWLTITSMTTLAFSDVVPQTHCSRFFVWVGTFCGTTLTSFVIVTVISSMMPSPTQLRAISTVLKAKNRREFFNLAASLIQNAYRYHKVKRHPFSRNSELTTRRFQLARLCTDFREARRLMISESHSMFEQLSHLNVPSRLAGAAQTSESLNEQVAELEKRISSLLAARDGVGQPADAPVASVGLDVTAAATATAAAAAASLLGAGVGQVSPGAEPASLWQSKMKPAGPSTAELAHRLSALEELAEQVLQLARKKAARKRTTQRTGQAVWRSHSVALTATLPDEFDLPAPPHTPVPASR